LKLSFIIIEYYSLDDIAICYSSIRGRSQYHEIELIVSSNSMYSLDKQEELRAEHPDILWVFNERNGGFAYGMNRGLAIASGDYLIITNPDVKLLTNIDGAISYLESCPEVGAVGPQILDPNGIIQDSTREFMLPWNFIKRQMKRLWHSADIIYDEKKDYNAIQTCDWVIGAFIIFPRVVYQTTCGLDEKFFLYVEDMDFCFRIQLMGKKVVYYPLMKIQYKGDRKSTKSLIHSLSTFNKYSLFHILSYLRFLWKYYCKVNFKEKRH